MSSREIKPREVTNKNVTDYKKREGLPIAFAKEQQAKWEKLRQEREEIAKTNEKRQSESQKEFKNIEDLKADVSRQIEAIQTGQNAQNPEESLKTLVAMQQIADLTRWSVRGQEINRTDLAQVLQQKEELTQVYQQVELAQETQQQAAIKPTLDSSLKTSQENPANPQKRKALGDITNETHAIKRTRIEQLNSTDTPTDKNSANLHRETKRKASDVAPEKVNERIVSELKRMEMDLPKEIDLEK